MKRKSKEINELDGREDSPEKACVGSSILSLGTILNIPPNIETLEIHGNWDVVPAVRWTNGVPYHYRVLRKPIQKRCDKGVTKRRTNNKRSA